MENILITGGAGFIGAHLSRTLLADGHKVVVADDFTLGNRENVADCLENPNFTLVEQDVTDAWKEDLDGFTRVYIIRERGTR